MTNASDTQDPKETCRRRARQFAENARAVELRLTESRKALWAAREGKDADLIKVLTELVNQDQVLVQVLLRGAEALQKALLP